MLAVSQLAELQGTGAGDHGMALRGEMRRLWRRVIERRAPQVLDLVLDATASLPPGEAAIPCLQAANIWFQLARIIEENSAMRARRMVEAAEGPEAIEGSFARVMAEFDPQMTQAEFAALARKLAVGPTITAHPTEAKRVTVLEIHRRIYRLLVSLETERWTPREREDILCEIEGEIDLLWMTGELRLERPSLQDEIEWGLQFFRDAVFDAVPQLFERFIAAGTSRFGAGVEATPCVRFHSWIGGDRDGNPNVTAAVTREALARAPRHPRPLSRRHRRGGGTDQHHLQDRAASAGRGRARRGDHRPEPARRGACRAPSGRGLPPGPDCHRRPAARHA